MFICFAKPFFWSTKHPNGGLGSSYKKKKNTVIDGTPIWAAANMGTPKNRIWAIWAPILPIWADMGKKGAHIRPYPAHILHILMRPYREKAPIFWIWAPISGYGRPYPKYGRPFFFFFFYTSVFEACSLHPRYPSGTKKSKKARIGLF